MTTPAKVSTFSVKPANTCTFTYAYVAADGAYGRVAINASGGLPVYTLTALTPYADDTNAIGTSALRWDSVVLALDATIVFDDGAGNNNRFTYTDGTGPTFTDQTVAAGLTFDVQAFTESHTATWPDTDGTVTISAGGVTLGTPAAALGVGAVSGKIEIFNSAGASLGFLPIYATIT